MDQTEMRRRDSVLRAFFQGKDWEQNEEFVLKRQLVLRSHELLPDFPFLIDDEWEVVSGQTNEGKGDLLFANEKGEIAVVEVKFIDTDRTGRTARSKRTDSRSKVWKQAFIYAGHAARRYPEYPTIFSCYYTNENHEAVEWVRKVEIGGPQAAPLDTTQQIGVDPSED